jgi:hypothetical protein
VKKSLAALATIAIAALSLVVSPATAALASGTVTGTITDANTSAPITTAVVSFNQSNGGHNAFAGAGGTYTDSPQAGDYTVSISAPGYATEYYSDTYLEASAAVVTITDGGSYVIDAALEPESTITGTITDPASTPLSNYTVFLFSENEGWGVANSAITLADGSYSFAQLAPGNYKVVVQNSNDSLIDEWYADAYTLATATVIPLASFGSTAVRNIQLATGAEITGTVVDPIGTAVGVAVDATNAANGFSGRGSSNSGPYSIDGLLPQSYSLTTDDPTDFFAPAAPVTATAVLGSPATANLVVYPALVAESTFVDQVAPISGPLNVVAGQTYTWVVDSNGDANVYAILYSSPVYLGAAVRNPDNSATLTLTIPLTTTPGAHKLTFSSFSTDKLGGTDREYFTIQVTGAKLAATGVDVGVPSGIALLALLAGAFAVFAQRRASRA